MWSYNSLYHSEDEYSDELQHYGVIGMKWGVRRAAKAYSKASTSEGKAKAKAKLEKHMEKASKKLNKFNAKADKKMNKAVQKRYGLFGSQAKYDKFQAKAERQMYKGDKWFKSMDKTFSKQSVVSMNEKDIRTGEKFAKFFERGADFKASAYRKGK